jgi:hypothetical protein
MAKVIRLTESDLIKLVQRIVEENEQQSSFGNCSINCMPTRGAQTDESRMLKNCCDSRDTKSQACKAYINMFRKKDVNSGCKSFSFVS